jgi:hypothetical protein
MPGVPPGVGYSPGGGGETGVTGLGVTGLGVVVGWGVPAVSQATNREEASNIRTKTSSKAIKGFRTILHLTASIVG